MGIGTVIVVTFIAIVGVILFVCNKQISTRLADNWISIFGRIVPAEYKEKQRTFYITAYRILCYSGVLSCAVCVLLYIAAIIFQF